MSTRPSSRRMRLAQSGAGTRPHAGAVHGPSRPAERRGAPRIRGPGIERRRRGAIPRIRRDDLPGSCGRHWRPRTPAGLLSDCAHLTTQCVWVGIGKRSAGGWSRKTACAAPAETAHFETARFCSPSGGVNSRPVSLPWGLSMFFRFPVATRFPRVGSPPCAIVAAAPGPGRWV